MYKTARQAKSDLIKQLEAHLSRLGFVKQIHVTESIAFRGRGDDPPKKYRSLRFVKHLNEETDIFFYPGISIIGGEVDLNSLAGVENATLRRLAQTSNNLIVARSNGRVCHKYLAAYGYGLTAPLRFGLDQPMEEVAEALTDVIERLVLPEMSKYDDVSKVRILFRSYMAGEWNDGVAILEPNVKLRLLQDGYN